MVGLVIVSHSRPLAESLVKLVRQVTEKDIPISYSGGAGPDHQDFGTDAMEIYAAIQSVFSDDGVLILMDLGSAVLSAEMAVDLLPPEMHAKIRFSPGPLIEGAIAAGVQVSLGSDLETVYREAQQALVPKADHLGVLEEQPGQPALETPGEGPAQEVEVTLENAHGLHARPAARFVQTAADFDAQIQVRNRTSGKGPVSAKSLNALATLGAVRGDRIVISATGSQADQALVALRQLVEERFGEREVQVEGTPPISAPAAVSGTADIQAVPVSEGFAIGPVWHFRQPLPPVPTHKAEDPDTEWQRIQDALAVTREAIQAQRKSVLASLGESQAAIFDAHLLILDDPDLLSMVREKIQTEQANAALAWHEVIQKTASTYRELEDPYLKGRAIDVEDVGQQMLMGLAGATESGTIELPGSVILVAQELTPSQTAQLDMDQVFGLVTAGGGPTSHSAILARALGIPAISGVGSRLVGVPDGTLVAVDGFTGEVHIDPDPKVQAELEENRRKWLSRRARLAEAGHTQAITRDGIAIEVVANVGDPRDAETAVRSGAEGIGLLRTEFLYLTSQTPPSEEEQFNILRRIGDIMGTRQVIVRTLDVGGDKPLPYIQVPEEENPFLGVRAIRLSLERPDLLCTQLKAILRAGFGLPFRVMFPMVTSLEEISQARQILIDAHEALFKDGIPHLWPIDTGIMVETPAAALLSDLLAPEVDFFSIGTNDLTQYTLAAERGNPQLSGYSDALNPAVLRLIASVARAAHQNGKWVGVCGELAGDPVATAILVGLGVDELSLNPAGIPGIKATIRSFDMTAAQELAREALKSASAETVRALAREFYQRLEI